MKKFGVVVVFILAMLLCVACGEKKGEQQSVAPPPPEETSSQEVLPTLWLGVPIDQPFKIGMRETVISIPLLVDAGFIGDMCVEVPESWIKNEHITENEMEANIINRICNPDQTLIDVGDKGLLSLNMWVEEQELRISIKLLWFRGWASGSQFGEELLVWLMKSEGSPDRALVNGEGGWHFERVPIQIVTPRLPDPPVEDEPIFPPADPTPPPGDVVPPPYDDDETPPPDDSPTCGGNLPPCDDETPPDQEIIGELNAIYIGSCVNTENGGYVETEANGSLFINAPGGMFAFGSFDGTVVTGSFLGQLSPAGELTAHSLGIEPEKKTDSYWNGIIFGSGVLHGSGTWSFTISDTLGPDPVVTLDCSGTWSSTP